MNNGFESQINYGYLDDKKQIVVGVDGGHQAKGTLDNAVKLSRVSQIPITLVQVVDPKLTQNVASPQSYLKHLTKTVEKELKALCQQLPADVKYSYKLMIGDPVNTLIGYLKEPTNYLLVAQSNGGVYNVQKIGHVAKALMAQGQRNLETVLTV
ncbi:universal stress protein [uncultured Secundilactobacillus sp.]|uniref:universal stress protein n=1 Tax=uncultured Secundilactobacillus sp. TaxID=2813935 RepID=UPI002587E8B5|nr:universal stress protein [uncultured Secundilactobacillus sp.]